jgi:hypothetical protein
MSDPAHVRVALVTGASGGIGCWDNGQVVYLNGGIA